MSMKNNTPDNEIRQRYFLISKRWTVALILLALVIYGCTVLWSEFVFSVSTSSDSVPIKRAAELEKLGCVPVTKLADEKFDEIPEGRLPSKRSPWRLDRNFHSGYYIDFITKRPGCLSTKVLLKEGDSRGSTIYFYDRATDKPVVKVTIESIDQ